MRALAGGEPICSLPRISDLREREAVSLRREVSFVLGYPLSYEGMERVTGVEPVSSVWKTDVLPMYYTRFSSYYTVCAILCTT